MLLSRTQIEERLRKAFRVERVEVPELEGHVGIRAVSGAEREAFLKSDEEGAVGRWLSSVLVDDEGDALFSEPDEVNALPADVIDRLFDQSLKVNGIHRTGKA